MWIVKHGQLVCLPVPAQRSALGPSARGTKDLVSIFTILQQQ